MQQEQKQQVVEGLRDSFSKAAGFLLLDFTGLTVAEVDSYRGKLRESDIHYQVVKNTLMKRAIEGTDYAGLGAILKGSPTGVVIGGDDPVSPAKITFEFMKDCPNIRIKGGMLDGKVISATEAEDLSKSPSKEELQASVVMLAMSPGRNIAGQIKNPSGDIVGAIDALVEKLEAAS